MPTVGFIGVGRIGEPMVERLIAAGHDVEFYSRRPEVVSRLESIGARAVAIPSELAIRDIVISCLYSDEQTLETVPTIIEAMKLGSVFVSHTTGTTMVIETLARQAARRSVGVVDAGFSGTAELVRAGELTLLLGGAAPDVDKAKTVLTAYSSTLIETGELGSGMRVKILNNVLFAAISQCTLSVIAAAQQMGVDEATLLRVLRSSSGGSKAVEYIESRGGAASFIERVQPFLKKDVEVAARTASEMEVDVSAVLAAVQAGPMKLDI